MLVSYPGGHSLQHPDSWAVQHVSSRTVTGESVLLHAGCVPVFVGPPYNSMPLAEVIDYPAASVIFNVTNTSGWLDEPAHWPDRHQAASSRNQSPAWWLPDIDASHAAIQARLHAASLSGMLSSELRQSPLSSTHAPGPRSTCMPCNMQTILTLLIVHI